MRNFYQRLKNNSCDMGWVSVFFKDNEGKIQKKGNRKEYFDEDILNRKNTEDGNNENDEEQNKQKMKWRE